MCIRDRLWIIVALPVRPHILTAACSYPLTWTITSLAFVVYYDCFSRLKRFNLKKYFRLPRF